MTFDHDNPVVRLCAEGMAVEGDQSAARALFAQAWALCRDDFDASIAAHYLARHQHSVQESLRWNALAVHHAEAVPGDRAHQMLASLYLNLAESYRLVGDGAQAAAAAERARDALALLPPDGYRALIAGGIERLLARLQASAG
jgi:hypothetical protein